MVRIWSESGKILLGLGSEQIQVIPLGMVGIWSEWFWVWVKFGWVLTDMSFLPNSDHSYHSTQFHLEYVGECQVLPLLKLILKSGWMQVPCIYPEPWVLSFEPCILIPVLSIHEPLHFTCQHHIMPTLCPPKHSTTRHTGLENSTLSIRMLCILCRNHHPKTNHSPIQQHL